MSGKGSRSAENAASGLMDQLKRDLSAALQRYAGAVDCAYVFGSTARGDAGPLNDVDLALVFSKSLAPPARTELAAALAGQLQRLAGPALDVTILNEAPPALKHRVIRDGRLAFVGNDGRRVEFETQAIKEFLDFQPVLDRYDKALFTRAREGHLGS